MESASACPVCSELSRSLKKFERELFEERRWNLSQREYCMQLQQEMQKDKDLWQRQEYKLREDLRDLNNKLEELYKTIQEQNKEKAHLEYKNEVLEDQKQELQDKVTMLQDKVKHLCAEMSTAQYRARILEEKLTAATKLLEESHKLKARISQAEGQRSRLEMKVNRLQEEKELMQAELNHMRDQNCQMQMQLIEQQQKVSCLDAETQQMQLSQALVKTSDSFSDSGSLRDSIGGCRESSDFTPHEDECAAFNRLQIMEKEMEYEDRSSAAIQNNCILKWQQQTAIHNGGAAEIHQLTGICTLTPMEVVDSPTEGCDLDFHLLENFVEENGIKRSCFISKDNQKTVFLNEETTACDTSQLDNSNNCFSSGNEIHMNVCEENVKSTKDLTHNTTVSENVGNLRKNSIKNSIGYTLKYGDENVTEIPIYLSAANEIHMTFTDKADNFNANNLKEVSLYKNVSCTNSDNFINCSESFASSDNVVTGNALQTFPHEQAEDMRKRSESACYHEKNQADVETFHPRTSFCGECMSQSEQCCNAISEETENKGNYARSFTHNTKESTNMQHSTEITSKESANSQTVSECIDNPDIKESNPKQNGSARTKRLLKSRKNSQPRKEDTFIASKALKDEASQTDSPESVKTLEKEALKENVTNRNKGSLNLLNKRTANRKDNQSMNKKIKSSETKNETNLNEVSEEGCLDLEKCSQSVSSRGTNEGSSNSENSSQRAPLRNNEGSSNSENSSQRASLRNNEGSSNSENSSQRASLRNNEGSSNSENSSQRASPRNMEGSSNSEKSSQRASSGGNGSNKLRGKSSNLDQKGKSMGNASRYKANNHSETASESLSNNFKNNNNANDLMNNSNTNVCDGNIQNEIEMLNDSATLQCETSNEEYLKCEKASDTANKEDCSLSSKTEKKLDAISQNNSDIDNNVLKQRNMPQSGKNVPNKNTVQQMSLNKPKITVDNNPVHKHNIALCNKYGCKYTPSNKNKKITVVHKKTSPRSRDVQNENEISSSIVNKITNSNVHDNVTHKKNILKHDRNNQTLSGVQCISLSKNKNIDESIVCQNNASEYNRKSLIESEIALNNGTDTKLIFNKNALQCNEENQSINGVQCSSLQKNSNNYLGNPTHKNTSRSANGIPSIALCKRNKSIEDDTVQKTNLSQYNENILSENEVQLTASDKTSIVNNNLVHKKNKQWYHTNRQTKNATQSAGLSKHRNKVTASETARQSVALNKHKITDYELTPKKKMLLDEQFCNEDEILCTALSKSNDTVDDKTYHKINITKQPISSSNRNNVNANFEQEKGVSQSNNNIRSESEVQSITMNKNNDTKIYDHQCRKNTTQWNRDIQSNHGIHPVILSESAVDNYLAYKRNTLKCETYDGTESRIQPITAYKHNGFVIVNDKGNIPHRNGYIHNQNEIKVIAINENKHNEDNDLVFENNKPHCSKAHETDNGSHSLELEVLHETAKTCMINCDTSSSDMCSDVFDSNIKTTTKTCTQVNSLSSSEEMDLVSSAKEGKFSKVEELLSLGTCPNCVYNGNTALHAAAETGNLCMCKLLLEAGARVDARDSSSGTPLHAAAKCGNLQVGKLLVKWGANVELRDKTGNLASDIAVNNSHIHMYNWLQEQVCLQEQ